MTQLGGEAVVKEHQDYCIIRKPEIITMCSIFYRDIKNNPF